MPTQFCATHVRKDKSKDHVQYRGELSKMGILTELRTKKEIR